MPFHAVPGQWQGPLAAAAVGSVATTLIYILVKNGYGLQNSMSQQHKSTATTRNNDTEFSTFEIRK